VPPEIVGAVWNQDIQAGDTLATLGARYGVEPTTLAADNALKPGARLAVGESLQIDNRHIVPAYVDAGALLINLPQRMLFLGHLAGRVEAFPIAVGRADWKTPTGAFTIVLTERNPTWDVPESILEEGRRSGREYPLKVPPGPNNPLGAFWLGLSFPGVGIHGTNVPSSIFKVTTHGCMRMHPDDIAYIFERVTVGTRGRTMYAPVLLALHGGRVYLEVHRDAYRRAGNAKEAVRALAEARGVADRIDWTLADAVAAARHGIARDVTFESGS
jgi:L,D-transpeptidase ErfK/SrfK